MTFNAEAQRTQRSQRTSRMIWFRYGGFEISSAKHSPIDSDFSASSAFSAPLR